jgi:enamine deaminase RidA (YjgF/YER057c/UK114 family)
MRRAPLLLGLLLPLSAAGQGVTRHPIPGSDFPIAQAVEVPGGVTMVHLSGAVPPVANPDAPRDSAEAWGDTRVQTAGTLRVIEATLRRLNLTMGDVVRMQVFLVGDPARGGRMDFDGFMAAYREHFGTPAQPNLPVRSVVQVAGLVHPRWLVEIEVSAVRR